ncbi:CBS domain-containing protein [Azohydromonas caseinilytica]|uniref:CBS domain-containing protein n=1 Tax=Azohydromonas caseinilytica TaxID=2728836 RepID=A0A848FEC6_9BURK|nr:CBS domain-containing protein [Azohydromonas caseinilytica]NML17652.1 CBS domain-containing protein [Azohydromonas caseinilytica]
MNRPVSSLMQRWVCSVDMDTALADVEGLFAREGLSWVPVLDEARTPVGVISAADLLRARAAGRDAAATPAWQLCSYRPVTVAPQLPVGEAARLMVERDIHHLIVLEEGRIAGVVSALDLVRCLITEPASDPPAGTR